MQSLVPVLCVIAAYCSLAAFAADCDETKCDNYENTNHYRELGCTAVKGSDGCCAERYECPSLEKRRANPNKCFLNGKEYGDRESVDSDITSPFCSAACFCNAEKASFTCANIECPSEAFGVPAPPGCHYVYTHDHCCAVDTHCPSPGKDSTEVVCKFDGKSYHEGEKVYDPSKSFHRCICKNGELDCVESKCGVEIRHGQDFAQYAAPKFYGPKGYCPIQYLKHEDGDQVEKSGATSEHKCKYGPLEFNVGDKLIPKSPSHCTTCTCSVPPLITCIQDPKCK